MRSLSRNMVSTSVVAMALSVIVVGTIWASSSALTSADDTETTGSTTTSVSEDSSDSTVPAESPDDANTDEPVSVNDLYEMVRALSEEVDTLSAERSEQDLVIADLEKSVKKLSTSLDETNGNVKVISDKVNSLLPKLSKLSDEGIYTGTITPNQLTRKFTTDEITGDWPLDRTRNQLSVGSLKVEFGSCSPDSRYNVLLSVDPFRNITCLRVLK